MELKHKQIERYREVVQPFNRTIRGIETAEMLSLLELMNRLLIEPFVELKHTSCIRCCAACVSFNRTIRGIENGSGSQRHTAYESGQSPDIFVEKTGQTKNKGRSPGILNMANTYTKLYIQFVFAVRGRENLIRESFRDELEKVMCGIIAKHKCKTYAIYANPDHTHILVGMHPDTSASKLMEQVKSGSSKWINDQKIILGDFSWQKGFGAFTYSKSQIDQVVKYVLNQPIHHKKQSFKDEYLLLLKKFEVDFDPKYLFDWYD